LIAAPGFFDNPLMRQAYLRATWMGPARISIDPVKDAKADREYLDMGATSLTAITAARFGLDHRDVRKRRQEDGSESVGASGSSAEGPDEEDDDDTSDNETAPGARHAG
jgi:capsid protein